MTKQEMKERLEDFCLELFDSEKSDETIKKYRRVVTHMLDTIDHDGDVTKADLIRWKKMIAETLAVSTQHNYIITINKFLEYLETGDVDSKSRQSKLRLKNVRFQDSFTNDDVFSSQEYIRMEKYARKHGMYETMLTMELLAHTGIRFKELQFVTVEAVRNRNKFIVRNKGKTREVIIPDATKRKLNRFIKENGIETGYVFSSARDKSKPLPKSTFWDRIQKIAGWAKISKNKAHAHSLRHLFAKTLLEAGEDPSRIADILGHSSLDTTRKYLRTSEKEMRETMNKVKYGKKGKEKGENDNDDEG